MWNHSDARRAWTTIGVLCTLVSTGCIAQQADLKQTEKSLQQRIKQSNDESAQTRARQSQEILALREQDLPQLRGELERAMHQAQELQGKQEDLKQRASQIEQQTKKLEQLAGKIETDSSTRYAWVQKSLDTQDLKTKEDRERFRTEMNSRLDDVNKQMETLRKELIEAVQKTNSALMKSVDARLEEQRKTAADSQNRSELLAAKFAQFSQTLTGFRDTLTGLNERLVSEEQANKAISSKVESDIKASTAHINETNKAVTGHLGEVNKSVASVAQKFAARFDEQDNRLDALAKSLEQIAQDVHLRGGNKTGTRQAATRPVQRSASGAAADAPRAEQEASAAALPAQVEPAGQTAEVAISATEAEESRRPAVTQNGERSDKLEYERLLALFRDGDLDGSRQGFAAFLRDYSNSDLAPNARYWLGESHYGKKDYKQAIDSYDRVELDFPQSEKVPAAILKKGYAYLAMKDKKRASSAFKQVVTLYPRSPEAGKASDKLSQLKESR